MLIEKIKVTDINPSAYNPRVDLKPGDPEYEKLKKSINSLADKPGISINLFTSYEKYIALAVRAIKIALNGKILFWICFLGQEQRLLLLKRACYGVELDPRFCDVIIRRYIEFVGRENVSKEIVKRYFKKIGKVGKNVW